LSNVLQQLAARSRGIADVVRPRLTPLFGAPMRFADSSFHRTLGPQSSDDKPLPNAPGGHGSAPPIIPFQPQTPFDTTLPGSRSLQHPPDNEQEGEHSSRMPAHIEGERQSPLTVSARVEAIQFNSRSSALTSIPETESSSHSLREAASREHQVLGSQGRIEFGEDGIRPFPIAHARVSQRVSDPPERDGVNGSLAKVSELEHATAVRPVATPFDKSQGVAAAKFAASLASVLRNSPHVSSKANTPGTNQTVEVTIGRLEVRIGPPESKPARASRTVQPNNLEEYLRRRAGAGGK